MYLYSVFLNHSLDVVIPRTLPITERSSLVVLIQSHKAVLCSPTDLTDCILMLLIMTRALLQPVCIDSALI